MCLEKSLKSVKELLKHTSKYNGNMKLLYDIIRPRCPICNYSGKKVAIHINEEHFKGSSADISSSKPDNDHATAAEEFPSLALESGDGEEESERRNTPSAVAAPPAQLPASSMKLAAKKSSFLSEWRCSIWEAFNRTLS